MEKNRSEKEMDTVTNWNLLRAKHWHLFMPPARPSAGELKIYARKITAMQGEAALLGATPELRTLAHQNNIALTAYDKSRAVFDQLRPEPIPVASETLIQGDWLQTIDSRKYDMALADGSLNMLAKSEQPELIERIADMLRPGGIAVVRIHLKMPPRFRNPIEVFEAFRYGKLTGPVFSATRTQLDMLWLDPETDSVKFSEVASELEKLYTKGHLRTEEYSAYSTLAPYNRIELHYSRREPFEAMASKWFDLHYMGSGHDYADHEQHPIYELRKR